MFNDEKMTVGRILDWTDLTEFCQRPLLLRLCQGTLCTLGNTFYLLGLVRGRSVETVPSETRDFKGFKPENNRALIRFCGIWMKTA